MIERFRADERAHRDAALAAGAERAPGFPLLSARDPARLPCGDPPFRTDLTRNRRGGPARFIECSRARAPNRACAGSPMPVKERT